MNRQKHHDENGDGEQWVKRFLVQRFSRPGDERFHFAWRIERRGRCEYDADLPSIRIERGDVVG
jgi:hypothetical protein